jgi:hypothetical protein
MIYDKYLFGERHCAADFIGRVIEIGRAASV